MLILNKIYIGFNALLGYIYKWLVDFHLLYVPNLQKNVNKNCVVSLTSYGRRVKTCVVYYTLISLLRQTVQPDRIILWLAESEWNDDTIPNKLRYLKKKGIEIYYCKDIKSYKKLIPTLQKYPNETIITVDDDIIYSKDTLSTMLENHNIYKDDILCYVSRIPNSISGIPQGYRKWKECKGGIEGMSIFPVGYGGTLYPANSLHEYVCDEKLFMSLCPMADDVWFWFCGIRKNTYKRCIEKKGHDLSFDSIYQFFHKGSALTHTNNLQDKNDNQIIELFNFFKYRLEE